MSVPMVQVLRIPIRGSCKGGIDATSSHFHQLTHLQPVGVHIAHICCLAVCRRCFDVALERLHDCVCRTSQGLQLVSAFRALSGTATQSTRCTRAAQTGQQVRLSTKLDARQ